MEQVRFSIKAGEQWLEAHPAVKTGFLVLYYLAIISALVLMYGRGDFTPPPFVYQEF
ncbi:MAG: D-Ala-teichoic acid biosynthesis protein [Verrucomicrobiota bacterium]|jgi:hypothetical protein